MRRPAPGDSLLRRAFVRFVRRLLPVLFSRGRPTWPLARLPYLARVFPALCLYGCTFGSPHPEQARALSQGITGGAETQACEWPALAALGGCSGTLVHPSLVVYAAHCGLAMAEVRFGINS